MSLPLLRILVVDECPAVRQFVDLAVGSHDVQVIGVPDGHAALACVERLRPHLVLAATGLAGFGDHHLAVRLSSRKIPVVLMTGSLAPMAPDAGVAAAGILTKPLQVEQLRDLVSQLVIKQPPVSVAVEICDEAADDDSPEIDPVDEWLAIADASLGGVPKGWRRLAAESGPLYPFARDVSTLRDGRVTVKPLQFTNHGYAES